MADWLRWWHGTVTDPKFLWVARKSGQNTAAVIAVWSALLEEASQAEKRGDVSGFDAESMDVLLGLDDGAVAAILDAMEKKGLIEDQELTGWARRQPVKEDVGNEATGAKSAAERKREQRDRERMSRQCHDVSRDVTTSHDESRQSRVEKSREEETYLNPLSESSVVGKPETVLPPTPADDATPAPDDLTQKIGAICRMLRHDCGIPDVAPHHLTRETWAAISSKRSFEEIREFALAKKQANPGKRFGIKYLAPGLLEDPKPLSIGPPGQYPPTGRQARISSYIAQENAAKEAGNGEQLDDAINGTARRVDSP